MLFGVVIGLAGFFQSRDLGKKAIIDGKVFQVRVVEGGRWSEVETIVQLLEAAAITCKHGFFGAFC